MSTRTSNVTRRAFLYGSGGGLAAVAAGSLGRPIPAAAAPPEATYHLENGFFRLEGAYGKLTEIACDPAGAGNYEAAAFHDVFLGVTDFFDSGFNGGVAFETTADAVSVTGIQLPSTASLTQDEQNSPVPLSAGHTLGQTFTTSTHRFTRVGGQLPTWSNQTSTVTLSLYEGTPENGLTLITERQVDPVQDNGWAYLEVAAQPAGVYYVEITHGAGTPGWWSQLDGATVDVGGMAYADREADTERVMTLDVTGYEVDGIASWDLSLDKADLALTYEVQWQSEARVDPGLTLATTWVRDGYSMDPADGIGFSRFFGDEGSYMPAQQLKRRDEWTTPVPGAQAVTATGTGPYDLRLTGTRPILDGTMSSDSMALALTSGNTDPEQASVRSVGMELQSHTDELPAVFPVFEASDEGRAGQVSTFYWERALSYRFDGHAMSWADWHGRILDWTSTTGSRAQADSLLNTGLDDDGYVWAWPDSQGWPFPDPELFDARHFTTNAMYILGAWRYYSWTGDSEFLATMLPRLRSAMSFYLDSLDGSSGIVTITSPDHDGRYGALPSNYWDVTSFGYRDAYLNAYFYGALEAMAQIEEHQANRAEASRLRAVRGRAKRRYNRVFWNENAGRYVQTIDVDGVVHDYGSTYVNLEAASFGLPTDEQAARIFDWLDHGHTELQDAVVLIDSGGLAPQIEPGHSMGQAFTANAEFTNVGARFPTYGDRGAAFTMALYSGAPDEESSVKIADQQFADWSDGRVAHLEFPAQAPGVYYLEVSEVTGSLAWWSSTTGFTGAAAYSDGILATDASSRFLVALADHVEGPADIYSAWVFAPRSTTRRNSFWFFLTHLTTPWGEEVQDGGAIMYTSGFDVMARARYRGADDAWTRMTSILDRWSEPDHICGGAPLFRGESTVDGTTGGSSVGTDVPFPESGLAPASFLYAFIGLEATPKALVITPNLPAALDDAGVRNLVWRGHRLDVSVTRDAISISGDGIDIERTYTPGESVQVEVGELP